MGVAAWAGHPEGADSRTAAARRGGKLELAHLLALVHAWLDDGEFVEDGGCIEQGDVELKVKGLAKLAGWSDGIAPDAANPSRLV